MKMSHFIDKMPATIMFWILLQICRTHTQMSRKISY